VNAPVVGVVAPTVPLILIEAVPVRLVTVPLEGVPKAPPLTTGAPAEPTLIARAVATPVPRPDTPVEIGSPVALVNTAADGVPKLGVTNVGEFRSALVAIAVAMLSNSVLISVPFTTLFALPLGKESLAAKLVLLV
jgi:hypothetical protein